MQTQTQVNVSNHTAYYYQNGPLFMCFIYHLYSFDCLPFLLAPDSQVQTAVFETDDDPNPTASLRSQTDDGKQIR